MRTTIRKAHRWPIGASRTVDHAPLREGERLPGCRIAMAAQAVDTTRHLATGSSTGLPTAMAALAANTTRHLATGSSTGLRTPMVALAAVTTGHLATGSSTGLPIAIRRTGQEAPAEVTRRPESATP